MSYIYITQSFIKQIEKNKNITLEEVINEIQKSDNGNNNLIHIYSPENDFKVLKGYLCSKKNRVAILLRISKNIYIPFYLAKKESKNGWNLSKYSEEHLSTKIIRTLKDIKNNLYEKYQLSNK